LGNGDEVKGQQWKEILEVRQRQDKKLRETAEKRRKKSGAKWGVI